MAQTRFIYICHSNELSSYRLQRLLTLDQARVQFHNNSQQQWSHSHLGLFV